MLTTICQIAIISYVAFIFLGLTAYIILRVCCKDYKDEQELSLIKLNEICDVLYSLALKHGDKEYLDEIYEYPEDEADELEELKELSDDEG